MIVLIVKNTLVAGYTITQQIRSLLCGITASVSKHSLKHYLNPVQASVSSGGRLNSLKSTVFVQKAGESAVVAANLTTVNGEL